MNPDWTNELPVSTTARGPVEDLYEDYMGIVEDLSSRSPSGLAALNRSYHKHLLVAAASSLEDRIKRFVQDFFERHGRKELGAFVSKQVMARSYHALFDWRQETAAGFFSSFGEECGANFKRLLKADEELKNQHQSFMRLGNLRNNVVHNDYATYTVELTPKEVMEHYYKALLFTARLEELIVELPENTST